MEKEEFYNQLKCLSNKIEINIEKEQIEQFYLYMNSLIEWNEKINLTAITEPKEIIQKHFIDSLTINKYIMGKEKIIDLGTGAGFPGIPLKICNKDKNVVLVDSLNKRINFLNEICKLLDLQKIECIHARAEELARNSNYREKYDVVTSRAVARLNVLVEYMLPFIRVGGLCICMKGHNVEEEINEAQKAIKILGGEIKEVDNIFLPNSDIERNIIVIEKVQEISDKYPRKAGVPAKMPL